MAIYLLRQLRGNTTNTRPNLNLDTQLVGIPILYIAACGYQTLRERVPWLGLKEEFCKNRCVSVAVAGNDSSPAATPGGRPCLTPATTYVVFTSI